MLGVAVVVVVVGEVWSFSGSGNTGVSDWEVKGCGVGKGCCESKIVAVVYDEVFVIAVVEEAVVGGEKVVSVVGVNVGGPDS